MSLDGWLRKRPLQELDQNILGSRLKPISKRFSLGRTIEAPPLAPLTLNDALNDVAWGYIDMIPRELEAQAFPLRLSAPQVPFLEPALPWSLTAFHHRPEALVALEMGVVEVVGAQDDGSESGHMVSNHTFKRSGRDGPNVALVRDLAVSCDDSQVFAATDSGILVNSTDQLTTSELATRLGSSVPIQRVVSHPTNPRLVASGDKQGSVAIYDTRINGGNSASSNAYQSVRVISTPHGPNRPPISAMAWLDDHHVVSASTENETIKFWDVRKTRGEAHSVVSQSSRQGITDLISTHNGKLVWALGRASAVFGCSMESERPLHRLTAPGALSVNTYYPRMAHLSNLGRPGDEFIACGGSNGVTVFTLPSLESTYFRKRNTASAAVLDGYHGAVTGVQWHAPSQSLLTVSDDCAFRSWTTRGGIGNLKAQSTVVHGETIKFRTNRV